VKELLGHSTVTVTMRYTHSNLDSNPETGVPHENQAQEDSKAEIIASVTHLEAFLASTAQETRST